MAFYWSNTTDHSISLYHQLHTGSMATHESRFFFSFGSCNTTRWFWARNLQNIKKAKTFSIHKVDYALYNLHKIARNKSIKKCRNEECVTIRARKHMQSHNEKKVKYHFSVTSDKKFAAKILSSKFIIGTFFNTAFFIKIKNIQGSKSFGMWFMMVLENKIITSCSENSTLQQILTKYRLQMKIGFGNSPCCFNKSIFFVLSILQ